MSGNSIIDTLDDLEIKINLLQKRIIGSEIGRLESNQTIEDILIQSDSFLEEAVSSVSVSKDLLKRREELSQYLDPTFWDSFLDTVTKTQIILDAQDELKETIGQLTRINDLIRVTNTETFHNIPTNKAELLTLTAGVLELQEQSNRLKSAVKCLMTKYMNIVTYTNQVLMQLCLMISDIEDSIDDAKESV